MWSSVHARGYTLVILITIFLSVWNDGHQTNSRVVGETRTTQLVECQAGSPCPEVSTVVNTVTTTVPDPGGGDGRGGSGQGQGQGEGQGQGQGQGQGEGQGDGVGVGLKLGQHRH